MQMDKLSKERRSWNMSRIKSKNTNPEKIVRSFLHNMGFRFRIHRKDLPGKPDIVLPKYKTIIEVRGCYWHRHKGCREASNPKSNISYWQDKFNRNIKRDKQNKKLLNEKGWTVIIVWECQTENTKTLKSKLNVLYSKKLNTTSS
jgi:DNA mismatch endonuclease (patch repair protein)